MSDLTKVADKVMGLLERETDGPFDAAQVAAAVLLALAPMRDDAHALLDAIMDAAEIQGGEFPS